jgi:4-amino-4-deoxy-L-arabinose transferase-like glycosyltransferase
VAVLVALIGLLVVIRSLPWSFFNGYDQSKQAFVSLEMVRDGILWYPHTPAGLYASKPPLLGWISAGLYVVTGSWECAWRLPSLAAFALAGSLLFGVGRRIAGTSGGYVAVAVFGLNMLSLRIAGLVRTDMLLALWILIAGALIWRHVEACSAWQVWDRVGFAGVVLVALFTKGPVLLAFLLPGLAAFYLAERRGRWAQAWPGWGSGSSPVCCSPCGLSSVAGAMNSFTRRSL